MTKRWARQVDEALNARFVALVYYFSEMTPQWLEKTGRDRFPIWIVEQDIELLHELVVRWLPAVMKQVFEPACKQARPEELAHRLAEEVVAMRPLGWRESKKALTDSEDRSASSLLARRLMHLFDFHTWIMSRLKDGEEPDAFVRRHGDESDAFMRYQEREAWKRFPKMVWEDAVLLHVLAGWRLSLTRQLRAPLVEKAFSGLRLDATMMLNLPLGVELHQHDVAELTSVHQHEAGAC